MKNITNKNDYSHSVGYQDAESEKGKMNYVIAPGETIQVPDQHASLFEDTEGLVVSTEGTVVEDIVPNKKEEVKNVSLNKTESITATTKEKDPADEQKTNKVFICPTCGIEFGRENVMIDHKKTHQKEQVKEENGTSSN